MSDREQTVTMETLGRRSLRFWEHEFPEEVADDIVAELSTRLAFGPRPDHGGRPMEALWDLRRGLWFGYPRCCVAQFALGTLLGVHAQGVRRGGVRLAPRRVYVPCRWHQGRESGWSPHSAAIYAGGELITIALPIRDPARSRYIRWLREHEPVAGYFVDHVKGER